MIKEEVYKGCRVLAKYLFENDTKGLLLCRCNGDSKKPYKVFLVCSEVEWEMKKYDTFQQARRNFLSRCRETPKVP